MSELMQTETITAISFHQAMEALEKILAKEQVTGFFLCRLDADRLETMAKSIRFRLGEEKSLADSHDVGKGCPWCAQGNSRVVSSIDPEGKVFVHHTQVGRVVCSRIGR